MPIQVQGPDGQEYEFPDGTSRETMKAAMAKRYAAPAQSAPKPEPRKPVNGFYTAAGATGYGAQAGILDGLQHHLLNIPVAIAQAGVNSGDWLGNKLLGPRKTSMAELVKGREPSAAEKMNQWVREREANYQARTDSTPQGKAGSYAGATVGEILPWLTGLGELRAAGILPQVAGKGLKATAKKGALLALEGGAMGATVPVVNEGSFGAQKAAQVGMGAVAAPVLAGGTAALGKAARYATPGGRDAIANERLAELYGSDKATIAALQQQTGIPGFKLTPAQALATPEAVQAERILRNQADTAPLFANREAANNAALRGEAGRLAGTDADMAAAKANRTAATKPYYDTLPGQMVDPAPILQQLDALAGSSMGVRPNIKSAAGSLKAEILARLDDGGKIDASILSGLRENVGSHLGPMASAQEKRALGPVADSIADTLDRAIPGYRANLAAYASASSPIRDMEAGRALVGAIDSGGRDASGGQAVTLNHLKSLLSKDDRAKYRMSPEARAKAEAMLKALQQRSVTNNTIAASGPGTAADTLRGAAGSPVGQWAQGGLAALLGGAAGGVDGGLMALLATGGVKAANNNITRRLGQKAASAEETAAAIQAYQTLLQRQQGSPLMMMLPYQPGP